MGRYFYDGKEQSSPRGRITKKEGDVVGGIVMMSGMIDTNGKNIEFLAGVVEELIRTVNNQQREIVELRGARKPL